MTKEISNFDDYIDSRDVIARIEELTAERDDAFEAAYNTWDNDEAARGDLERDAFAQEHWEVHSPSEADELKSLLALQDEAEGYAPDWQHGAQLIRDSYFTEAMEEVCKDIGDLPRDIPAYLVIDWEATADNLKVDYTSADFDGVTYWVR